MSGEYYPQQQQQEQQEPQHYPPQQGQYYSQEKKGLQSFFIAKDKLGLFMFLCAGMILIGFLFINLGSSGLLDSRDAIRIMIFLGTLAVDAGLTILLTLIIVAGIYRDDLPEKTRNWMILVFGIVMSVFVLMYIARIAALGFF